jgi:hypothetical protein
MLNSQGRMTDNTPWQWPSLPLIMRNLMYNYLGDHLPCFQNPLCHQLQPKSWRLQSNNTGRNKFSNHQAHNSLSLLQTEKVVVLYEWHCSAQITMIVYCKKCDSKESKYISEINLGLRIFCWGKALVFNSSNFSCISWPKALVVWRHYLSAGRIRLETQPLFLFLALVACDVISNEF